MAKKKVIQGVPLAVSMVRFDADAHKYWLGDKELSGITSMLSRMLFQDKYKGVDKAVLDRAADRGSNIHFEISMWESSRIEPACIEAKNYVEKIRPQFKNVVASEYLVSDGEAYASSVDIVTEEDGGFGLWDIKSMKAGPDMDYVSWQLSSYAYMFEKMNPGMKVVKMGCIWVSDNHAELKPCERWGSDIIAALLAADKEGLPFERPSKPAVAETEAMLQYRTFEQEYMILQQRLKELDELKKTALENISKTLEEWGVTKLETEHLKFTMVEGSVRQTFGTTKFKKEHPDMVDAYMKQSITKGYLKVSLR